MVRPPLPITLAASPAAGAGVKPATAVAPLNGTKFNRSPSSAHRSVKKDAGRSDTANGVVKIGEAASQRKIDCGAVNDAGTPTWNAPARAGSERQHRGFRSTGRRLAFRPLRTGVHSHDP